MIPKNATQFEGLRPENFRGFEIRADKPVGHRLEACCNDMSQPRNPPTRSERRQCLCRLNEIVSKEAALVQ